MMTLTSLGTIPLSLPLAVPSGLIELMLIILAISGLGIVGSALARFWRRDERERGRRAGRIFTVARHAMPA